LNQSTGNIYVRKKGKATRCTIWKFCRINQRNLLFQKLEVASVIRRGTMEEVELESTGEIITEPAIDNVTFLCFVQCQPQWNWWGSQLRYTKTDLLGIAVDIKEGKGVAVSDGSFKGQNGTAAVLIEGTKAGRRVTSSAIVSGGSNKQCAYRSEVARILAALQMVNTIAHPVLW
jgi:hypothetical protein